jgi:hypothetical protein
MNATITKVDGQPVKYDAQNLLPETLREGMRRYIERRQPCGGFLTACLENNFADAVCLADADNALRLRDIARWIHNFAPRGCHGSREKVRTWLEGGGR